MPRIFGALGRLVTLRTAPDRPQLTSDASAAAPADRLYDALIRASLVGFATLSHDGTIETANPALAAMAGLAPADLPGRSLHGLVAPSSRAAVLEAFTAGPPVHVQLGPAGQYRHVELHVVANDGEAGGWAIQAIDISDQVVHEDRLRTLALTDSLTGLGNRLHLAATLRTVAGLQAAEGMWSSALMLLDLDGFKAVNDANGHAAGDATLHDVAAAMQAVTPPSATLARIGGDEFAVLIPSATAHEARRTGELIARALRQRHLVLQNSDRPVVTASVGITMFDPASGMSVDELLGQADLALYAAKRAGRDRVEFYDPASDTHRLVAARSRWLDRLRSDLTDHLVIYAQPIVPTVTSLRPSDHVELLVRYRDDDGTIVPPEEFLPVAEKAGLIGRIDQHMLTSAAELVRAATQPLQVAVNVSAWTFCDPSFLTFVREVTAGLPRGSIVLELTETAALNDSADLDLICASLRATGCLLALDDFGVGYASFANLDRIDVDLVKIDGSFVRDVMTNTAHRAIVTAIAALAGTLAIDVVAEHVEDAATAEFLANLGITYLQGFHLGRPAPACDLLECDDSAA
jgi:diguanylate cyclase (GGDEF)-like protein/PAS domain S-box-containing protein